MMVFSASTVCCLTLLLLAGASPASGQARVLSGTEGRVQHLKPSDPDWVRVVGSYEIRVCRHGSDCADDTGRDVLQTSYVAIRSDSIERAGLDPSTQAMLQVGSAGHGPANACYVTGSVLHQSSNYAHISSMGLFASEPTPGSSNLKLWLGASIDAFYEVDATLVDGRLEGVGRSIQVGNSTNVPDDTVVGYRTGPPDIQRCFDAARAVIAAAGHNPVPRVVELAPTRAGVPMRASEHTRFPTRLGAYVREGPAKRTPSGSSATYVNNGTRIDVVVTRITGNADDALNRAAAQFDSICQSTQHQPTHPKDDTVTVDGRRYSGVSAAVVAQNQGDVGVCLTYAFALDQNLLRETAAIPPSQVPDTDVPLFAHELARQVVRTAKR